MELLEGNPSTFRNMRGYFGKNVRLSECRSGIDSCMKTSENFNFMDSSMRGNMYMVNMWSMVRIRLTVTPMLQITVDNYKKYAI